MPIRETDPWRLRYFENVPCPDDVWISTEDPNQLIYFFFWDDMPEREKKWPVFLADPEWIRVRDASQVDGPITSKVTSRYFTTIAFTKPMNHTK